MNDDNNLILNLIELPIYFELSKVNIPTKNILKFIAKEKPLQIEKSLCDNIHIKYGNKYIGTGKIIKENDRYYFKILDIIFK